MCLDAGADRDEAEKALLSLRGIGPWTAGYIRMRALGDPGVLLTGDVAVQAGMQLAGVDPADAERWRPWRDVRPLWRRTPDSHDAGLVRGIRRNAGPSPRQDRRPGRPGDPPWLCWASRRLQPPATALLRHGPGVGAAPRCLRRDLPGGVRCHRRADDPRWRAERTGCPLAERGPRARVLRLRADDRHIWIETGRAEELEHEELTTFEHGGFGGPSGASDFPYLPYTWQLVLLGPGDTADYLPGGRLASTLPHLQEALETLVKVWIEQLPVQQPGKKATFTIASSGIKGGLTFAYDTGKGILLRIGSRTGDPIDVAAAMSTLGWTPSGTRWKAEFKNPTENTADEVATLIVGELAARGLTDPLDLVAKRIAIGPHGFLRTTGLGISSG